MAKFQVGDSPNSSFTIGNSRCVGGTWYSAGDVGIDEDVLARDYPFLKWDSPVKPKSFPKQEIKKEIPKEVPKPKAKKK